MIEPINKCIKCEKIVHNFKVAERLVTPITKDTVKNTMRINHE